MACLALGAASLLPPATSAAGVPAASQARRVVDVIEVAGRIDPVVVDFVSRAVARSEATGGEALVIQLDSPGSLVDRRRLEGLVSRLRRARVPVAVWVGPSGARAYGAAVRLLEAADVTGMAPGTRVGRYPGACGDRASCPGRPLATAGDLGPGSARARGAVSLLAPTVGDFIVDLDGRSVGPAVLHTARVVERDGQPRREPDVAVRFAKPGLAARLLHTVATPSAAYLLLVAGLLLLVFEFFTVGVGLVGLTGAVCLVLAALGLGVLPTRPLGLALLAVGVAGFAVDVQAGAPRAWTVIGTLATLAGSLLLYGEGVLVPWWHVLLVMAGMELFMVAGMAATLRARFATPTLGRESMVGEEGQAATGLDPEGTVRVRGAVWRARTNRVTPIAAGLPVRVVGIEGLVLRVEPADPPRPREEAAEPPPP